MHIQQTDRFGKQESKNETDHILEYGCDQCKLQGIGDDLHIILVSGEYGSEVQEAYIVKLIRVCGPVGKRVPHTDKTREKEKYKIYDQCSVCKISRIDSVLVHVIIPLIR